MIGITIVASIILLLQRQIGITQAITCASNPCGLIAGIYDGYTGYCCYENTPSFANVVCSCPNNVQTINTPCRAGTIYPITCNQLCYNGGVCNVVNGQQICVCPIGFTGVNCEFQGVLTRCSAGVCQAGTCYEQAIGGTIRAYCQCLAGYTGPTCNQRSFTCPSVGVFPDAAQCAIGRFFYCQQALAAPALGTCPVGQRFNRFTNRCDSTYQCT